MWWFAAVASAAEPVALVELFTSEGCSSCPPADALVAMLAENPSLYTLSWHVDYWDGLGWPDPFASRDATDRQRAYVRALDVRGAYTPQVVVNGATEAVGSDRSKILDLLAATKPAAVLAPTAKRAGGALVVTLPALPDGAIAHAAVVQRFAEIEVKRGENAGRTLHHRNIVRTHATGGATVKLPLPAGLSAADADIVVWTAVGDAVVGVGRVAIP